MKEKVGGVWGVDLASICCDNIDVAVAAAEGAIVDLLIPLDVPMAVDFDAWYK